MYINYRIVQNVEYAVLAESKRDGDKVTRKIIEYLGRVIDKEQNIFKSKDRGVYKYDLENKKVLPVPPDYIQPKIIRKARKPTRPKLILSFGDVFVLDTFLKQIGFYQVVDALEYGNSDTSRALLLYYILSEHANQHAEDWYDLTFVKYLYPHAQLASQRISEALSDIGSEWAKRSFFKTYSSFLEMRKEEPKKKTVDDGILIDSTGLPNSTHLPITAVNNHGGSISQEIRLIFAVQQSTGLPLFFRYVASNVIDASTIVRTIAELKANGVNTKFAILDAGYYNHLNADALFEKGVSFISRMDPHFSVYKKIIAKHLPTLESKENMIKHNGRFVFVKAIEVMIGKNSDHHAYAYLCKDLKMRRKLEEDLENRASDHNLSNEDCYLSMAKQGVFILISSRKIAPNKILNMYYIRDKIEKIFKIDKSYSKLLPLNVEKESTFRGHLMMTFMAAVVYKLLQDKIAESGLTTESMFLNLHEQHVCIYDQELITTEPTKKMNNAYKALGIECPAILRLCDGKLM